MSAGERQGVEWDATAGPRKVPAADPISTDDEPSSECPDETYLFGSRVAPFSLFSYSYKGIMAAMLLYSIHLAYHVRLLSVEKYGHVIHEFDPWFNYRAAEYMSTHGWTAFFRWFDHMSWYPLGRPVGSTTYPGLQFTAVAIHRALAAAGMPMSLNDVCVLIPAWFGAIATAILALIAFEMSSSISVAVIASLAFSTVPAHLMRSMAGEFDNECIAVAAMLLVFYFWTRSLRTTGSWPVGALTGIAYGYMVAAWGGYIFVLNMVALHAGVAALVDWARNTYNPSLLRAYALFYVIGTALATRVPPVGMSPFRSLEQLGALVVLLLLCVLHVCERIRKRADVEVRSRANLWIRMRVFGMVVGVAALVVAVLAPTGYFGPLSVRVSALFVTHTRTGNPLVDSVAEHRAADASAYLQFLGVVHILWLFSFLAIPVLPTRNIYAVNFVLVYGVTAYYFSTRMVRLLLLAGPVACLGWGALGGTVVEWCFQQLFWNENGQTADMVAAGDVPWTDNGDSHTILTVRRKLQQQQQKLNKTNTEIELQNHLKDRGYTTLLSIDFRKSARMNRWPTGGANAAVILLSAFVIVMPLALLHSNSCMAMAHSFASPRLVFEAQLRAGERIIVKDYLEAYDWLERSTPEDARVLAWWDYGYQITGIGNRTSLADGNTWNHEHIATIGKLLTSPVAEAHALVRHMADYVLIWTGEGGDLLKSPHMARIGNSVYHDICPDDPVCRKFGFFDEAFTKPTPTMRASLLYNLHEHQRRSGVQVESSMFTEVYSSKYGLVRIFKVMNVSEESKAWIADPANRVCDQPGSWICRGQYPPAREIQEMLAHRVPYK